MPTNFDYQFWEPFLPEEVALRFSTFFEPWCIAGGWGLDLRVGQVTRTHADIDVAILRKDQLKLHDIFSDAEIFVVDPPGALRDWSAEEYLFAPLYNIWIRESSQGPWKIQVMLQDHTKEQWLFRRDHSIRGSLENWIVSSKTGIPVLSPEIQLLYKAKSIRDQDQHDLALSLPHLSTTQRIWLREKIRQVYGEDHIWLKELLIP